MTTNHVATVHRWSDYVREGTRPDFVIEVPDAENIVIRNPTGDQLLAAQKADDPLKQIRLLCGDDAERLIDLVRQAPAAVINNVAEDILTHFIGDRADRGNSPASSTS